MLSQLEDEPEPDDVNMRLPSDKRLPACMGKMSSCLCLKNPYIQYSSITPRILITDVKRPFLTPPLSFIVRINFSHGLDW